MVTVGLVEANSIADRCGPCSRVKSGAEGPLGSVTSHRWADRLADAFGSCEDGVWPQTVEPRTRMKELARLKCVLPFMTSPFAGALWPHSPGTNTLSAATSSAFGTSVRSLTLCRPGFFSGLLRNVSRY